MTWLILGVFLWMGAHLFKRILPKQRAALGKAGKAVVAVVLLASVGLMIIGYGDAEKVQLYALPISAWHLNNLMMLAAIFMLDAGRVKGVVRTKLRHPMLLGVVIWSAAHLLVNGDVPSLVLFGGLGLWALLEMAVISRADGPWLAPAEGSIINDGKVAILAAALYAAFAGIHYWLGYSVIAFL
jgi:uncharacterized membrane protein